MRITIVTWGSYGDVFPYISLALGLKRAGHEVRLATNIGFEELVEEYGLESLPMDWNIREYFEGLEMIFNFPPLDMIFLGTKQLHNGFLAELWRVCQQSEAIIFNSSAYPCYYIAEKLGIPCYAAPLQPYHQTRAFPHPFVFNGKPLGNIYNWFSYSLFDQVFWQFIRRPINQWRQKTLNLPPLLSGKGVMHQMQHQKLPFLYAYSPASLPKPSEWPESVDVTGYWFLDSPSNWQPPQDLVDFLADGSAPVYVGFSNKGIGEPEALTKLVLEALKISGQRGILLIGEDFIDNGNLPDYVFPIEWIPFDWLFPKTAAVVHHGGCGTVHTALRAGVPNIIIPEDYDNVFWGYRIAELGVAPLPIPKNKLSVKRLAAAIETAVSDQNMQTRVAALSKKVQAENGVQRAVEVFHKYLPSQLLSQASRN
ncbi:glycosyltransferase [Chlorogloeopsis sp. ULAP01]|uniref:glycosyltransferase n=1 Tax=Chlorogloeopsis sp. ULAP01 TaxID=3056483 RepID=UPI0025AA66A5|nr:glycosyltransferase [Chlorogloeopsis sp. ULAP01]MDM9379446.1 glycosyltransferase [Chlorogloeopsis sp. ULAP01]